MYVIHYTNFVGGLCQHHLLKQDGFMNNRIIDSAGLTLRRRGGGGGNLLDGHMHRTN